MSNKSKNYLSQSELYNAIIDARIKGYMTRELGEKFMLLASKCANHRYFVRYHHLKEEIIAIGAAACCKAFPKFKPFKDKEAQWDEQTPIEYDHNVCSNSFSFFTTVIFNDIIHFLKKEYKQSNIINEKRLASGLDASYGYVDMISSKEANEKEEQDSSIAKEDPYADQTLWEGSEIEVEVDEADDDHVIDWQDISNA